MAVTPAYAPVPVIAAYVGKAIDKLMAIQSFSDFIVQWKYTGLIG